MSGNGARGSRRGNGGGRGRGKGTIRKEKKGLGKAALRSIVKNESEIQKYIDKLEAGIDPGPLEIAKVIQTKAVDHVVVKVKDKPEFRASMKGLLRGRGNFWKNPEVSTAVRKDGYVLVEDIGLGHMAGGTHHNIIGVFDPEQARHAKRLLHQLTENAEEANMYGFVFDRTNADEGIRSRRAVTVGAAARELASMRRGTARGTARRSSSGKTARSSETSVSSNVNWASLSEERKAGMKEAKLTRRKERRKAKRVATKAGAAGGGGAWSWFSF